MTPRIPPLPRDQWPPEFAEAVAALRPAKTRHPILTTEGGRPRAMNALATLANHVELMHAYHVFTGHLLYNTTLDLKTREILILRVAAVRECDYEWLQHVVIAGDLGLSDAEIAAARGTADTPLLRAVDELLADARISDATWAELRDSLDTQQLMDLVFTVGAYDLLAMAFLSFGVEVDADLASWTRPS